MLIRINNKEESYEEKISLNELLVAKKMIRRSIVWLNGRKIKNEEYKQRTISEGDSIKIIRILAGG